MNTENPESFHLVICDVIVDICKKNTTTGSYCVSYDDILEKLPYRLDKETLIKAHDFIITTLIIGYKEVACVYDYEDLSEEIIGFDLTLYTDYCPNFEKEDDLYWYF